MFSIVGAKPGASEAAEAVQLRTESRPQRVHRAIPAVLATTAEIHTPAETDSGFREGGFIPALVGRRLSHPGALPHSTLDRRET